MTVIACRRTARIHNLVYRADESDIILVYAFQPVADKVTYMQRRACRYDRLL